ncbi:MAG TPA: type IV pilus assembly protein PilM [Candidatus Moranbacteria bacterium]|nr:type IV pilus assembly protein PilM [Candidatus Moranbacteria bacterium]
MLEFLKGKKNNFIGVDFGTSSIKVVELSYKDQKVFLENYGIVDLKFLAGNDLNKQKEVGKSYSYEQNLVEGVRQLFEKMKPKAKTANVSIPAFYGLITIIEMLDMQDEELAKAIQFEAHKYIPSSLDEISMSWEIIERVENPSLSLSQKTDKKNDLKKIKVLLVAAPKKDIDRYGKYVATKNIKVGAIELETFSLVRSLVGEDAGNFLIIDIGLQATNIILVEKGIAMVNRSIDAGGNEITLAIADSMNISNQRAEALKKGERDFLNNKESALVIPVLEFIASEAKRIVGLYISKNKETRIDGVILSGGTSKMKGLEEYFSRLLETKVVIGNPWHRIMIEDNAKILVGNLGGSFSVALGLALRGIEEYKRK